MLTGGDGSLGSLGSLWVAVQLQFRNPVVDRLSQSRCCRHSRIGNTALVRVFSGYMYHVHFALLPLA